MTSTFSPLNQEFNELERFYQNLSAPSFSAQQFELPQIPTNLPQFNLSLDSLVQPPESQKEFVEAESFGGEEQQGEGEVSTDPNMGAGVSDLGFIEGMMAFGPNIGKMALPPLGIATNIIGALTNPKTETLPGLFGLTKKGLQAIGIIGPDVDPIGAIGEAVTSAGQTPETAIGGMVDAPIGLGLGGMGDAGIGGSPGAASPSGGGGGPGKSGGPGVAGSDVGGSVGGPPGSGGDSGSSGGGQSEGSGPGGAAEGGEGPGTDGQGGGIRQGGYLPEHFKEGLEQPLKATVHEGEYVIPKGVLEILDPRVILGIESLRQTVYPGSYPVKGKGGIYSMKLI